MNLLRLRSAIGPAALIAFASLTSMAAAASIVPPGNSAATQYTETFPTSGGEAAEKNGEINGANLTPSKVLGSSKAHKLDGKGADGKAVAALTAATAPRPVESDEGAEAGGGHLRAHAGGVSGGQGGGGSGHGSTAEAGSGAAVAKPAADQSVSLQGSSGSSGVGQVLSQATGSSSGQLGLLLPLLIVGTLIWSLTYLWRQRRPAA